MESIGRFQVKKVLGEGGQAGPDETMRLIACMASDLSAAVVAGSPDEQQKRTAETLDRYKGRLKLNPKAAEAVFASSLQKFRDYTVAVGWKLDQAMAVRLGALQAAAAEAATAEGAHAALAEGAQIADIEKTLQANMRAKTASPSPPPPEQARKSRDVLSGGIQDITNAMVEARSLNDILRIIVETIYTGIGFDHVVFALRDPRQERMLGRFGLGGGIDALVKQFHFPLDFAPDVFHIALQKNIDIFITDSADARIVTRIPDWSRQAFSAGTFVLLPIIVKDKPFGMIYGDAAAANSIRIQKDELKLLRTLRNQAVLALRQSA